MLKQTCSFHQALKGKLWQRNGKKHSRVVDPGGVFGVLLTELSKAFDYIPHNQIIAKLIACGFQTDALKLVNEYLSISKQRVKINEAFGY